MAIPDKIIDEIQEKTDIVETISQYIPLKKLGRNYKALCPFHHEKTPSFVVSPDKQIYHCFGCNAGGNVFSFVMKYENVEFPEAVEMLASKAGVVVPRSAAQKEELTSLAKELYKANEFACQFFQGCLAKNKAAGDYLAGRGIGEATIKKFRIGYAPDAWETLVGFLKSKGAKEPLLEKAGLAVSNERGGYYDRFRNRIIFPIMDLKDRVLGFGGRVLDASLPKYINSPETFIYSKGKNLYGLNFSRNEIKRCGHALMVEGYLDYIIPYQAGVTNIIATLGTALTIDQIKLLKRFANTVVIVYDPDEAGEAASMRNLDLFLSEDANVYIAELPAGFDPDNYIRKFGAEEFGGLVKSSKNIFDYKLDKLAGRIDMRTAHGKARIASEMLPTISRINNAVVKSTLVKKLADRLGVDEDSIRTELKKVKPDYSERKFVMASVEPKKDHLGAEKMLLALLLEGERYISKTKGLLALDEFKDTSIREMVKAIFDMHTENRQINPAKVIRCLDNSPQASILISEAVNLSDIIQDKDKVLDDCIVKIKKDNMKDRLDSLQTAIKTAHNSKDEDVLKRLVTEYNSLVKNMKVT